MDRSASPGGQTFARMSSAAAQSPVEPTLASNVFHVTNVG